MPTDDLTRFCCQNPDCDSYGRRGEDNILAIDHFGKARHRLLDCRVCRDRFFELKGKTPFNSGLPHDKSLAVLKHLADGCGVRQTDRLVGVNKDTVTRLALLAGVLAEAAHDELAAFSPRARAYLLVDLADPDGWHPGTDSIRPSPCVSIRRSMGVVDGGLAAVRVG